MAVLTSQIIIRMFDEYSYPVKTPSYIPQIAFYFLTGHKESANKLTLLVKLHIIRMVKTEISIPKMEISIYNQETLQLII